LIWISEIYDQNTKEYVKRTKGGNVRSLEMDEVTLSILEKRKSLAPNELIFGDIGYPLWMDKFYVYSNRAGIKKISFHAFRHTFASTMALYTPTAVLQKMLGHASWNTTMKYVHIAQSSMLGYTKHLGGMYKKERDANKIAELNFKRSS